MENTNSKSTNFKKKDVSSAFRDAGHGIQIVWSERNFRFHVLAAFIAYLLAWYLDFSKIEYVVLTLTCAMVFITETINTAIEYMCDRITMDHDAIIGKIKDLSAGAVLLSSIASIIVGILLYLDKIIMLWTTS